MEVTTLYRPVGQAELDLISASQWTAFPPRLPEQPIFYPVLNEDYAIQIARDWNTKDERSGFVGYVLQFSVRSEFLDQFDVQRVGGSSHDEYWIPAEDLDAFNEALIAPIRTIDAFVRDDSGAASPAFRRAAHNHDGIWDAVVQRFGFAPANDSGGSGVWQPDPPTAVFSFGVPDDHSVRTEMRTAVDQAALRAMRAVLPRGEPFLSLEWQRDTYEVWPEAMTRTQVGLPTPVLPDNDYVLHVHASLDFGFLGDPVERSVTVVGGDLIGAFEPPHLLRPATE